MRSQKEDSGIRAVLFEGPSVVSTKRQSVDESEAQHQQPDLSFTEVFVENRKLFLSRQKQLMTNLRTIRALKDPGKGAGVLSKHPAYTCQVSNFEPCIESLRGFLKFSNSRIMFHCQDINLSKLGPILAH